MRKGEGEQQKEKNIDANTNIAREKLDANRERERGGQIVSE